MDYKRRQPDPNISFPSISGRVKRVAGTIIGLIVLFLLLEWSGMIGYFLADVSDNEVGVLFRANQPYAVVKSGKWSNLGFFESIQSVKVAEMPFEILDEEVLTKDRQRIGVLVKGTVRRPGIEKQETLLNLWARYRQFYLDDETLVGKKVQEKDKPLVYVGGLMQSLGQQASKVCVGDLIFDEAVIGTARDVLRECIDKELDRLASGYGLEVYNIVVPNVVLSVEVQKKMDEITAARLSTDLAKQREAQNTAEANQERAKQMGQILVEQGKVQERAKQDKITADLQRQAQEAQTVVIKATKDNEQLQAERDLAIAKVTQQTAETNAKAALAPRLAEAAMFEGSPRFIELKKVEAWSSAWSKTDKIIVPAGTDPSVIIGQGGNTPPIILNKP